MLNEVVDLVKALAWPAVAVYLSIRFGSQISSMLEEMPDAVRRLRSVKAMGVEAKLAKLDSELPLAVSEARQMEFPMPPIPHGPPEQHEGH